MEYQHGDARNQAWARHLLAKLLPAAHEQAGEAGRLQSSSAVGEAFLPWMTIDNIDGVHVYQGEKGGWFADLVLKNAPTGVASIFGTPVQHPCHSREEAESYAVTLLAVIAANKEKVAEPPKEVEAAFSFGPFGVKIPSRLLDEISKVTAAAGLDKDSRYVRRRLDELSRKHERHLAEAEPLDGLPAAELREIIVVSAMALCHGIVRWPEVPEAAPPTPGRTH